MIAGRPRPHGASGFSLVELVLAMALVSGLMVAALSTLAASRAGRVQLDDWSRGQALAEALLTEAVSKDYADPGGLNLIGLELDEVLGVGRTTFDDVDDYDGYSASPPEAVDGSDLSGFDGWRITADVDWVLPSSPGTASGSNTGLKRVVVTVQRGPRVVAEATGLKSRDAADLTLSHQGVAP